MLRTGVIAAVCLGIGFAAGLAAAPGLRPAARSTGEPAPVALERADDRGAAARPRAAGDATSPRPVPRLAVAALGAAGGAGADRSAGPGAPAHAHEESPKRTITVDQLPAPLRAVVAQVAQGREIRALTLQRDTHDGIEMNETEFELDGMEHELHMDDQGKILASEVDFALDEVPAAVTGGIQAVMPGAVLLEAEREQILDRPPFFEIKVQHQGRRYEVEVGEDGRVKQTSPR